MHTSNLIYPSLIIGGLLLLALPYMDTEEQHDHRLHTVKMNSVTTTQITVCIAEGDTVAQVAFPHTNMKRHIDYDATK